MQTMDLLLSEILKPITLLAGATGAPEALSAKDVVKKSVWESFATGSSLSIPDALIALGLAFLLSMVIYYIYRRTYSGALFSHSFSVSLVLLTLVTTAVIRVISQNLSLSLGMVGALSIVRFRTAVKDAIDTVFMFWAIAVGILVGAGQYFFLFACVTTLVISLILLLMQLYMNRAVGSYLLVVHYDEGATEALNGMLRRLKFRKVKSKTIARNGVEMTMEVRLPQESTGFVDQLLNISGVYDASLIAYQNEAL